MYLQNYYNHINKLNNNDAAYSFNHVTKARYKYASYPDWRLSPHACIASGG